MNNFFVVFFDPSAGNFTARGFQTIEQARVFSAGCGGNPRIFPVSAAVQ